MFQTKLTGLLGIKYPIICGPMGPKISDARLVAAVSEAGGLGVLPAMDYPTPAELREAIKKVRSLTTKPFAVNVTLAPLLRETNYGEFFAAAIAEGVKIVETSARSPEPYMKMLKDAGVKVFHRATRTKDIQTAERAGVDAVAILGIEAAGLPGQEDVTSMVRIPLARDAVKIPLIAAGGIADARGFVAALALGADGVLMGTRFLVSQECPINPKVKEWLLTVKENDTILIERFLKNTSRAVKTEYTQKILDMEQKGAPQEEIIKMVWGKDRENAYLTGNVNKGIISAGQSIALVHNIPTVKEIIDGIISEAGVIAQRIYRLAE